jgi:hypothetical protein
MEQLDDPKCFQERWWLRQTIKERTFTDRKKKYDKTIKQIQAKGVCSAESITHGAETMTYR